ncbi:MAG: T9SS type A sorting domain-containing protein [Bacteroidetes bacterium]|nr:T9SS type A sorting domain-containing protein [Bacteroidota bacterium]
MKKLVLLFAAGCMAAGASAQYATQGSMVNTNQFRVGISNDAQIKNPGRTFVTTNQGNTANKTTAPTDSTRWYNHLDGILANVAPSITSYIFPMWWDSTVNVAYSNGLAPINFASAAQVISPSTFLFNDRTLYGNTTMGIDKVHSYRVDSLYFSGAYVRESGRPATIVDTLVISMAPYTGYSYWLKSAASWVANVTTKDTLKAVDPDAGTPANAMKRVINNATIAWKLPLTAAMGHPDSAGFVTISDFFVAVPGGGITIPAGSDIGISIAFKSGDVVQNPLMDTVTQYHRFYMNSYGTTTAKMPYTYYDYNDRNGSSLMFTTGASPWWIPTVVLEAVQTNPVSLAYEFHNIAARVRCGSCMSLKELAVKDVSNFADMKAYPNPANTEITVKYTLKTAAAATVKVTNAVGQTLKVAEVANGTNGQVTISTNDLANGIYFYTVEANGQRMTNRFVVTH